MTKDYVFESAVFNLKALRKFQQEQRFPTTVKLTNGKVLLAEDYMELHELTKTLCKHYAIHGSKHPIAR